MENISLEVKENKRKELLMVIALFLTAVVIRFLIADFSKSIHVYGDEIRYYGIARSLFDGNGLSLRNAPTNYQKIIYSIILAPFFAIKDGTDRISILSFINTVIICSSIFPVWLISRELQLCKKDRYLVISIVLLWPDMLFSMTFMSEILYWPLFLWFVFLWIINRKRQSYLLAVVEGVVCYIGYMCKEIFLATFLAYIVSEFVYPILEYYITKKDRRKRIRDFFNIKSMLIVAIFAGTFIMSHMFFKLTFFSHMGNSYNQMGISAILSTYNFLYMIYGFLYYIAAILLASMIFPIIYPVMNFKKIDEKSRKMLNFLILFLLIAAATIAYTITVREDLGRIMPRLHLRYVGPAIVLLFIILFRFIQINNNEMNAKIKQNLSVALTGVLIFICVVFKGIYSGSVVDQYSLQWYSLLQEKVGTLATPNNGTFTIYLYGIILNVLIFTLGYLLHFMYIRRKKSLMKNIFVIILVILCFISNVVGGYKIRNNYFVDRHIVDEIKTLNTYFMNKDSDASKIYLTKNYEITSFSKYFDTYFDDVKNLYMIDSTQIPVTDTENQINVSDLNLYEPIYQSQYGSIEKVEYIIVEKGVSFGLMQLSNAQIVPEISGDYYTVYKNLNPNVISFQINRNLCFSGEEMNILFTGDNYNASQYILSGISEKEDGYSWTNGNAMMVEVPIKGNYARLNISLDVVGTFNGSKSYVVRQKDTIITSGSIDGTGNISFSINPKDDKLIFEIDFPDAQVIKDVIPDSSDDRKVAFQLKKMILSTN